MSASWTVAAWEDVGCCAGVGNSRGMPSTERMGKVATLTVPTIMYSEAVKIAKGRLSESLLVSILKEANPSISDRNVLRYPADRSAIIANAMIAFRVAYRLGTGEFVIPALLAPEQPRLAPLLWGTPTQNFHRDAREARWRVLSPGSSNPRPRPGRRTTGRLPKLAGPSGLSPSPIAHRNVLQIML
jgi:hypothetical protein